MRYDVNIEIYQSLWAGIVIRPNNISYVFVTLIREKHFYHRTKNSYQLTSFSVVEGMTPSRTGSDQKLCDTSESSDLDTRSGNSISWSDYICARCCQCSFWIKYCLFTINFFVWVRYLFLTLNVALDFVL